MIMVTRRSGVAALIAESAKFYRFINLGVPFSFISGGGKFVLNFTPVEKGAVVFTDVHSRRQTVSGDYVNTILPEELDELKQYSFDVQCAEQPFPIEAVLENFFEDYLSGILTMEYNKKVYYEIHHIRPTPGS